MIGMQQTEINTRDKQMSELNVNQLEIEVTAELSAERMREAKYLLKNKLRELEAAQLIVRNIQIEYDQLKIEIEENVF